MLINRQKLDNFLSEDEVIDIKRQYLNKILREKEDLRYKIERLQELFDNDEFNNISSEQILLMDIQLKAMNTYFEVLAQRCYHLQIEIHKMKKGDKNAVDK